MPGIVGVFSNKENDNDLFNRMFKTLMHERYYKVDKFSKDNFSLGRVHLGIFNPEPQPIFNKNKSMCIFMDGKVYGYEKIKGDLKKKGYQFKTKSDAELCLYLFEEKGEQFVKELNGDFFICICDLINESIYLFNDRYGLRPHYYALNNGTLLIAPEAKAILEDKSFKKELNPDAISDFFAFGYMLNENTFFRNIKLLPPASIFLYKWGKITKKQYWDFKYEPDYSIKPKEFADKLVLEFKHAVQIRTNAKLRYGVSLSGGLDSRAVLAAIKNNVIAYTFGNKKSDEVKIAKRVADKNGTEIIALEINPKQILNSSTELVYLIEAMDYVGVSYIIPTHKKLKKVIDVSFEGLAMDLTLGGSYLNGSLRKIKNLEKLKMHLHYKKRMFSNTEIREMFLPKYHRAILESSQKEFNASFARIKDTQVLNMADHWLLNTHVKNWTFMGNKILKNFVEYSAPTYDNNVIDLILKMPPEIRINHRVYRKFLKILSPKLSRIIYNKTMLKPNLPYFIWIIGAKYQSFKVKIKKLLFKLSNKKIFIGNNQSYVNFEEWFKSNKEWQEYFQKLLLNEESLYKEYLKKKYVKKLLSESIAGTKNNSIKILYIATFELFLRQFFNDGVNNVN